MNSRGLLCVVALAVAAATTPVSAAETAKLSPPNLAGTWKIDHSRSDTPRPPMGNPTHPDRPMRERPEGRGTGPEGGRPGHGPARTPEAFTLVQRPTSIELHDSLGTVVQRIIITETGEVSPRDSAGVVQLRGSWQDGRLQAEMPGPRGGTVRQTLELTDEARALKITTRIESPDSRPPIEFTRVYQRVRGS